jgi:Zn-dependent protease
MMVHGIWINLLLCFFNLIPVPPLDGSHLLYHALPARAGNWYRGLQRFGYLPLFLMLFVFRGAMGVLLTPVVVMMRLLGSWIAPYQIGSLLAGIS